MQLADQLQRIRQAVVDSDTVVRDQVEALKQVGLVPRLDLLRAEAALQQSRYRLEQAQALRLSRQRQLSNLINVPFEVSLRASEAVRLQPPCPLDLERTILRGWSDNPQLQAMQAARDALLRQADRRAAELLPSLRLVASGGYGQGVISQPLIELEGCFGSAHFPQLLNQSSDWAAGLQLHWRFFDGGVTAGAVAASRAARTDQNWRGNATPSASGWRPPSTTIAPPWARSSRPEPPTAPPGRPSAMYGPATSWGWPITAMWRSPSARSPAPWKGWPSPPPWPM